MTSKYVCLLAAAGVLIGGCGGSGNGGQGERVPVNRAPAIGAIADQTIVANTPSDPIPFSLSDEELDALTLSITSDRQDVVPDANLSVGGSGGARSLTIVPVADTLGDALITVVVSDQSGLSASSAFFVTVDAEQRSVQQFARDAFLGDADDDPFLINAVDFIQDADEDDFTDLLAQ